MAIIRTCALLTCCAGYAGYASALDVLEDDLRLGYAVTGTKETETIGGTVNHDDWSQSSRWVLDWVANPNIPFIGVLFCAGLSYDHRDRSSSTGDDTYSAYGAHVHAGAYLSFFGILRLELMPFIGVGRAKLQESGSSANGNVSEYGANLNLAVHPPILPVVAGVGVGYLHSQSSHDFSGTTVDLKANVATIGAFVGWSF